MELTTRKPAVAGMFYPARKKMLKKSIQKYLRTIQDKELPGDLKALIVPHAGYVYSGQVAAHGFVQLKKWNARRQSTHPARIILLGPTHTAYIQGIVTDENAFWKTPLGSIACHCEDYPQNAMAHLNEHCLEVEVPFLQEILDDFRIIPLLAGRIDTQEEARRIIHLLDDDTILVVSSDLSHFQDYQTATSTDLRTIEAIKNLNSTEFERIGDACGKYPILILLSIAKQLGWQSRLLHYCNSGDVSDQHESVVGYTSIEFFKPLDKNSSKN